MVNLLSNARRAGGIIPGAAAGKPDRERNRDASINVSA
jgi:hypothetical protein